MGKPKITAIGSAAQDVFLTGKVFTPQCEAGVCYEHLKLGDKLTVEDVVFATGGNAMNASITFARQGLNASFVGVVGDDPAGDSILRVLDAEAVHTSYVLVDKAYSTKYSVVLLAPNGERTILRNQIPSLQHHKELFDSKIFTGSDWLYVSSLGSMDLLHDVITRAEKKGIKIAFNPASYELEHVQSCADLFAHVDVLALNKEEAQKFVHGDTPEKLALQLAEAVDIVLVSDGPRGAVATDGKELFAAGLYEDVPVIDRTGAGDAFTSGFLSQVALGKSLEQALVFASANSTSVVTKVGATEGILHHGARIHTMPIKRHAI